jgi:hypothetical protein
VSACRSTPYGNAPAACGSGQTKVSSCSTGSTSPPPPPPSGSCPAGTPLGQSCAGSADCKCGQTCESSCASCSSRCGYWDCSSDDDCKTRSNGSYSHCAPVSGTTICD